MDIHVRLTILAAAVAVLLPSCAGTRPGTVPRTIPGMIPGMIKLSCPQNTAMAKQFVCLHNKARHSVDPKPKKSLPALRWSNKLARSARAWASQCRFQHDPALSKLKQGENLAIFYGSAGSPARTVQMWVDENQDYRYQNNRCKFGKQCGHYTQVVWRDTVRVGCAKKDCNNRIGGVLWVCRYDPPGNYIGEKPY